MWGRGGGNCSNIKGAEFYCSVEIVSLEKKMAVKWQLTL